MKCNLIKVDGTKLPSYVSLPLVGAAHIMAAAEEAEMHLAVLEAKQSAEEALRQQMAALEQRVESLQDNRGASERFSRCRAPTSVHHGIPF